MPSRETTALVDTLLNEGCFLTIWDGGDEPSVSNSRDRNEILANIEVTDFENLVARDENLIRLGCFMLAYGNEPDELICDHSDNHFCERIYKKWLDLL